MSGSSAFFAPLSPTDLSNLSAAANIFLYGYLIIMCIGFVGNLCQILTFSRKTMRNVSTGVLFLALSISDTLYLLLCTYVLIVYGFKQSDKSDLAITCRLRHFSSYFTTNFSAWMLAIISCDRWIRTQFPHKAQGYCTPRAAIYSIIVVAILDFLLHVHLLTPLFGSIAAGTTGTCGANRYYPSYVTFYTDYWPAITIVTVTILPAGLMLFFLVAIVVNIQTRRNRVAPIQQTNQNSHEKRRSRFIHRQMFILMLVTLILFFVTTLPVALFRFTVSTLGVQQPFSLSLLLAAVFGLITASNYALNFYLHSLTSKLFRKEFTRAMPCSISIQFNGSKNNIWEGTGTQQHLHHRQQGTVTQLVGQQSNMTGLDKKAVPSM